jgi:hypothetical protein
MTSFLVIAMRLRTRALLNAKKSQAKKHSQENSSPQKEGRRSADKRIHARSRIEKGCGARPSGMVAR